MELDLPPYFFETVLPLLAAVLVAIAFAILSIPKSGRPTEGTTLRRYSIVSVLASVVAMFYHQSTFWEWTILAIGLGTYTYVYNKGHRKRSTMLAENFAKKEAKKQVQLAQFLSEIKEE